jgi:hypothetical protein
LNATNFTTNENLNDNKEWESEKKSGMVANFAKATKKAEILHTVVFLGFSKNNYKGTKYRKISILVS